MPIKQISVQEARERFLELLSEISGGTIWVIVENTTPVACIVPIPEPTSDLQAGTVGANSDSDERSEKPETDN